MIWVYILLIACYIIFLLLIFLLPLIPTFLTFKLTPDAKVFTEGNISNHPLFGNIKWNASGAVAAYIIFFILLFSLSNSLDVKNLINFDTIIKNLKMKKVWTVSTDIRFVNDQNETMETDMANRYLEVMKIFIQPEIKNASISHINIPLLCEGEEFKYDCIQFSFDNYKSIPLILRKQNQIDLNEFVFDDGINPILTKKSALILKLEKKN